MALLLEAPVMPSSRLALHNNRPVNSLHPTSVGSQHASDLMVRKLAGTCTWHVSPDKSDAFLMANLFDVVHGSADDHQGC